MKKKIIFFGIFLLLIVSCLSNAVLNDNNMKVLSNISSPTLAVTNSLEGYLFIGDSYTADLPNSNLISENVIYKAVEGVSPSHWISHFDELPDSVNGVMVLLGANCPSSAGINNCITDMKNLIDKLSTKYTSVTIYIQKVFPVTVDVSTAIANGLSASEFNSQISTFNNEISSYCSSKTNVKFVDTTTGYVGSDGYMNSDASGDGLHISDMSTWVENMRAAISGGGTTGTTGGTYYSGNADGSSSTKATKLHCDAGGNVCTEDGYNFLCRMQNPLYRSHGVSVSSPMCSEDRPNHKGIDLVIGGGDTIVFNAMAGRVIRVNQYNGTCTYSPSLGTCGNCGNTETGDNMSMGNAIIVETTGQFAGYKIYYMHLDQISARILDAWSKGEEYQIATGEEIGIIGTTGCSTGVHLHFQIVDASDKLVNLNPYFEDNDAIICGISEAGTGGTAGSGGFTNLGTSEWATKIIEKASSYLGQSLVCSDNKTNPCACSDFAGWINEQLGLPNRGQYFAAPVYDNFSDNQYRTLKAANRIVWERTANTIDTVLNDFPGNCQPGDWIFYTKGGDNDHVRHVAIYTGNNMIIDTTMDRNVPLHRGILEVGNSWIPLACARSLGM
ncbi:MAG: peptidoglycan DD-metalloendopeptidase family protein [bacterium]|nr:peptidoglycan DD-metalloendopeptidase family protein [bacterium]